MKSKRDPKEILALDGYCGIKDEIPKDVLEQINQQGFVGGTTKTDRRGDIAFEDTLPLGIANDSDLTSHRIGGDITPEEIELTRFVQNARKERRDLQNQVEHRGKYKRAPSARTMPIPLPEKAKRNIYERMNETLTNMVTYKPVGLINLIGIILYMVVTILSFITLPLVIIGLFISIKAKRK